MSLKGIDREVSSCQDRALTSHRSIALAHGYMYPSWGAKVRATGCHRPHQNDIEKTQHALCKACLRHEPREMPPECQTRRNSFLTWNGTRVFLPLSHKVAVDGRSDSPGRSRTAAT